MSIQNVDLTGLSSSPTGRTLSKREEFIATENQNLISLTSEIIESSELIYINGILLHKEEPYADYSVNLNTITMNIELNIGDVITVAYNTSQSLS